MMTTWLALAALSAHGQTVINGDFEVGALGPWTDISSNTCTNWCEDGSAAVVSEAQVGGNFPSGSHALLLTTGDQTGWGGPGGGGTHGGARSAGFLVTWDTLFWEQYAENGDAGLQVEVFHVATGDSRGVRQPGPSVGNFTTGEVSVASSCAEIVEVEITVELGQNVGWNPTPIAILWDDVGLGGAPCPMFVDGDGDGFCLSGLDLDGDGNCADEGEPDPASVDCDDADPTAWPGAPEIGGNGVDEDCDGVDAEPGATDPTDPGDTDPDDPLDPEETDDGGLQGTDERLQAAPAGCACDASGGLTGGWTLWLALLPVRRRS